MRRKRAGCGQAVLLWTHQATSSSRSGTGVLDRPWVYPHWLRMLEPSLYFFTPPHANRVEVCARLAYTFARGGHSCVDAYGRDRGVTILVRVDVSSGSAGVLAVTLSHQAAGFAPCATLAACTPRCLGGAWLLCDPSALSPKRRQRKMTRMRSTITCNGGGCSCGPVLNSAPFLTLQVPPGQLHVADAAPTPEGLPGGQRRAAAALGAALRLGRTQPAARAALGAAWQAPPGLLCP